jgi:hypothetical protein
MILAFGSASPAQVWLTHIRNGVAQKTFSESSSEAIDLNMRPRKHGSRSLQSLAFGDQCFAD